MKNIHIEISNPSGYANNDTTIADISPLRLKEILEYVLNPETWNLKSDDGCVATSCIFDDPPIQVFVSWDS